MEPQRSLVDIEREGPAFGEADLTNCERELIHLTGSIQPHGVLVVLDDTTLDVRAASANAARLLGASPAAVRGSFDELHPGLARRVREAMPGLARDEAVALQWREPAGAAANGRSGGSGRGWEGMVHGVAPGLLVLEVEPLDDDGTVEHERDKLMGLVGRAVERIGQAASLGVLADAAARCVRDIIGYDRVMVYQFDADGHGKIIAEASDPRLESLLGHHYPASDIPQRARQLYLSNRVRVLVDVHYVPSPLVRTDGSLVGDALDMSMCCLRSMSPLHLQYLKNMGVTATLVVSLVHEGRLWGLIAAHHYAPRNVRHALRSACDLIGEVVSTRIAAIENYAHAQVAVLVRRLEQRLVEATSIEGDWRLALFRNPHTLLKPLDATGAALFAEDEVLTAGEVPSTPELRELQRWVAGQTEADMLFSTSSVARLHPEFKALTPTASGVLAVRLSKARPDVLMWFRKEQLRTVTWAGDPHKPMLGDDPLTLSPRRSFAAWSELVRGTAVPWTGADLALGRAFGLALVDIIVQVQAVRLLVAERQLIAIRAAVRHAGEAVIIADAERRVLFCNDACSTMTDLGGAPPSSLDQLAELFVPPNGLREGLRALATGQSTWRGELTMAKPDGRRLPLNLRAEIVPGRDGRPLGYVLTLFDMRDNQRAAEARRHLEASLQRSMQIATQPALRGAAAAGGGSTADPLLGAILTNASLAAMDITDGAVDATVAPLLEELEASTVRATALYARVRGLAAEGREDRDGGNGSSGGG